jgi:hypothetical protein
VFGDEFHELGEPVEVRGDSLSSDQTAVIIDQGHVMVSLSPVDATCHSHRALPFSSLSGMSVREGAGDLMESALGATSHKPFTISRTGGVTVYV